jgi:PAS domain S-box-containing protein/diguanylate cyclase (GGDEF)-like protein
MGSKVADKLIFFLTIAFVFVVVVRTAFAYAEMNKQMGRFAMEQAQTLNDFIIVNRHYHQKLFIDKNLELNEKQILALPAVSMSQISQMFAKQTKFGIGIKSVSDIARNPNNQADKIELEAINYFKLNEDKKEFFKLLQSDEKKYYQYASVLRISKSCLTCHGSKSDAPKFIADKYDLAFDYKLGDVRGVISIKIPYEHIQSYFLYSFLTDLFCEIVLLAFLFVVVLLTLKKIKAQSLELTEKVDCATTELTKNITALREYQKAVDNSTIVSRSDLSGNITYVNDRLCEVFGYDRSELLGRPHNILRHPAMPKDTFAKMWKTIASGKIWSGIVQSSRSDGSSFYADTTITPILDDNGKIQDYIAIRHDVSEIITQNEKIKELYRTDGLTSLGNRFKLLEDLGAMSEPAVAILDINSFKEINDSYGTAFGDSVLQVVSGILYKKCVLMEYSLYRVGGDVFAIVSNVSEAMQTGFIEFIGATCKNIGNNEITMGDDKVSIFFSAGIAFGENAMINADIAEQCAKSQKKSMVVYSDELKTSDQYKNNLLWTSKLKSAIDDGRIVAYFQPIVASGESVATKYEALARLIGEDGRVHSPFAFLDIAKKTKLYYHITKAVFIQALDFVQTTGHTVSVNLSVDDILNTETISFIRERMYGSPMRSKVVFEIVESEGIESFEPVRQFIAEMKALGCKIAIDDFGTGYSNFEYLMKLDADYIKIDGSMIKNIHRNENARSVVETIVAFAQKNSMLTIAEFVADEEISCACIALGIDFLQGYYYAEPKPANEIRGLV